jgi:hypothetical protein
MIGGAVHIDGGSQGNCEGGNRIMDTQPLLSGFQSDRNRGIAAGGAKGENLRPTHLTQKHEWIEAGQQFQQYRVSDSGMDNQNGHHQEEVFGQWPDGIESLRGKSAAHQAKDPVRRQLDEQKHQFHHHFIQVLKHGQDSLSMTSRHG